MIYIFIQHILIDLIILNLIKLKLYYNLSGDYIKFHTIYREIRLFNKKGPLITILSNKDINKFKI